MSMAQAAASSSVSSLLLGAMVGAGLSGALSDRLGRRTIILVAATIFAVGAIGAGLSPNVETLIFFRFLLGLGVGSASALVPSYTDQTHWCHDALRASSTASTHQE